MRRQCESQTQFPSADFHRNGTTGTATTKPANGPAVISIEIFYVTI